MSLNGFSRLLGQLLFSPGTFYEALDIDEGFARPMIFLFVMSCCFSMLSCLYIARERLLLGTILFLNRFLTPFLTSMMLYLITLVRRGNRFSYRGLFTINAYADVTALFAWIPGMGIVSGLWGYYLIGLGIVKKGGVRWPEALVYVVACCLAIILLIRVFQTLI